MKLLLPAFILAVASLLPAVPASAQTTSPVVAAPTSLKRALLDWSWTWTGPQSNTVVTFQERGRLITQENQVSAWDFLSANTIRVTASGMRPVFLTFNQDFSHFVQSGGGMALIAGRRHQLLLYQNLLDAAHAGYWRLCGFLQIKLQNGLVDTASPKGPGYSQSVLWYSAQKFGDFSLRLDFNRKERCNSGVFIRFDDPGSDPEKPASLGHEVDINTADDTGGIAYYKRPGKVPEEAAEKLGEWNSMEISIIGSHIRVSLNHRLINEYDLGVAPAGYIGLQNFEGGEGMKFRNVRIKELPSSPLVARQPQTLAEALLGHGWRWHAANQGTSDPEFDVYFMPDGNVKHLRAGGAPGRGDRPVRQSFS